PPGCMAASFHRQRPRAWRVDPVDGPELQSADAGDRRGLVRHQLRADGGNGVDPDVRGWHRNGDLHRAHAPRVSAGKSMTVQGLRNSLEIEVENLEISYGSLRTVGPVSFSVTSGQQLTLLGPSGCGKTTTLRALAGLERPSGGEIRIGGRTMYSSAEGVNLP